MDLLAGEVGAVIESVEDRRLRQLAGDAHRVAVTEWMAARCLQADAAVNRVRRAVEPNGGRLDVEALASILAQRIAVHIAAELHLLLAGTVNGGVVVGQV